MKKTHVKIDAGGVEDELPQQRDRVRVDHGGAYSRVRWS